MNLPRRLALALGALLAVSGVATANAAAPAPRPEAASRPRLVFFMNPNGAPCQQQDRVLRDMAGELSGRAEVVYYRTTDPRDLEQFGRYGIRSLPLLLVTDASGRELRRAPPGIRSAEEIRRLLGT
jgi:thioredoxin 1